jgi:energy-coupling factor transport system ATP-binding protein
VTHLLEEAAQADRIIILSQGHVALIGPPTEIFADLGRLRALRLIVPEVARLAERLRLAGVPMPPETVTPEALVGALTAAERVLPHILAPEADA